MVRILRLDSGPPLFYLLEKPFVSAAEALALPDAAARFLPFVAIAVLFAAVRSLPPGARLRFLWLAASSPLFLLYASEARAYGVLALGGFLLFRLAARDIPGLLSTALMAAVLPWTHYLGLFLVGSLLVGAVATRRWLAAAALGLGLAFFLPWVPVFLSQPKAATSWIRDRIAVSTTGILSGLGGGARVLPPFGQPLPEAIVWLACTAGAGLLVLLLFLRPTDTETRIGLFGVLLTLGGLLVVSVWRPIAVAGRSELAVLPIWLWLVARAGERSRTARQAAVAVIAIGIISNVLILGSPRAARPFAEVPARLEASARAGDLVVATSNFYLPARLAHDRGRLAGELRAFPADLADHPGWFRGELPSPGDYQHFAEELSRVGTGRNVFLLLDPPYWTPRLREILLSRGPLASPQRLPYGLLAVSPAR